MTHHAHHCTCVFCVAGAPEILDDNDDDGDDDWVT